MLFDMDFEKNLQCPPPLFFHAQMEHGVIEVPQKSSKEILR
jgi:crispr-associated ramp csd5d family protein